MTDEAFHHKFGKIWADRTIPHLTEAERDTVEDWTAHCAQKLFFDLARPTRWRRCSPRYGLDPERVTAGIVETRKARDPAQADHERHQHLPGADQDPARRPA